MLSDDDNESRPTSLDSAGGSQKERDKLGRRNSGGKGSAWTSSVHIPASDIPINNKSRNMARQSSNLLPGQTSDPDIPAVPDPSLDADDSMPAKHLVTESNMEEEDEKEDEEEDEEEGCESPKEGAAEEQGEPVRMSLMSLLAENDEQLESGGLTYMMEGEEEDEEEEEVEDSGGGSGSYNSCCVCMVKHKGTAFEPCGHSFCRLCSKEMWVERGNCPLCNSYILEILDIF